MCGTRTVFERFSLRKRKKIKKGECIGKEGEKDRMWEDPVYVKRTKMSVNTSNCAEHCAQTYGEMAMNKMETLGASQVEDQLSALSSDTHRHARRDRNPEQGELQEKVHSNFCTLKLHEDVS